MHPYNPPLKDIYFAIEDVIEFQQIQQLSAFEDMTIDLIHQILDECGKISSEVIAPLNKVGDAQGCILTDEEVHTPKGWKEAYKQFYEGGWNCLPFPPEFEGQGLPWVISIASQEMITSANMAFSLCPLLNQAAIELLCFHGSEEQQQRYLSKLMSGEWTGTMNLTEPQAGTDLAAVKMKATPEGDHYRLTGQKIYITYGDHDLTENIIHMVLARTPGAPDGIRGISLFLVPKILVDENGEMTEENDLHCISLEHKLGIHGSPTAVMSYGDKGGAIGYLVGEENQGIKYMFTMMNNARLSVGTQGLSISDRAYQQSLDYANERVQGRAASAAKDDLSSVKIIHHPDVKRMLGTMKCKIEAMRYLNLLTASQLDRSHHCSDDAEKLKANGMVGVLIPVVKAWCTDQGCEITNDAIQVHGGMGYIEETGIAQHYRDAKIATIYEGTNGVQANDLVLRKVGKDGGRNMANLLDFCQEILNNGKSHAQFEDMRPALETLEKALGAARDTTDWIVQHFPEKIDEICYASVPYLHLIGSVVGGALMCKAAQKAADHLANNAGDQTFYKSKIANANIFAQHVLVKYLELQERIKYGHLFEQFIAA